MGATINNVGHGSQQHDEMNSLAVSYLGKPLHFLAALLSAMMWRLLSLFFIRNKEVDPQATFDKPAAAPPQAPRRPLVRLKNLPQVSGSALLASGGVRFCCPWRTGYCRFNSGTL